MRRRYASIDVGTNTLRLLIGLPDPGNGFIPVFRDRAITRLGGSFTEEGRIDRSAALRSIDALRKFSESLSKFNVDCFKAVGTSVLRRANNSGDAFLEEVLRETGLEIEVISGEEEALLTLKGVLLVIGRKRNFVVMDIGGGSTEYIFGGGGEEKGVYSIDMGVVSLTEKHLTSDPPTDNELSCIEREIEGIIKALQSNVREDKIDLSSFSDGSAILSGTAGTPTTLAAIDQGMDTYRPEMVNGYTLSVSKLRDMYKYLSHLTIMERRAIPSLEKGREDLIISGIAIILKTMDTFDFKEMIVSDSGLLEGVLLKLMSDKNLNPVGRC